MRRLGQITKHLVVSTMLSTKSEPALSSVIPKSNWRSGSSTRSAESTPKRKEDSDKCTPWSKEKFDRHTSKSKEKSHRCTPKNTEESDDTLHKKEDTDRHTPKSTDKSDGHTFLRKRDFDIHTPKRKLEMSDDRTPKRKLEESNEREWHSVPKEKRSHVHERRSLPSKFKAEPSSFLRTPELSNKGLSSSSTGSPFQSPQPRSCAADQTPYAEDEARRRKYQRTSLPTYSSADLVSFKSDYGFIDSHCHLDFLFQRQGYTQSYASYQELHKDTFPGSYKGCLAVFCNPFTFRQKHVWEKYLKEDNVWAAFGCHPHNAKDYDDSIEDSLCSALEHPRVRALGEVGLDYSSRNGCDKEKQFEVLRRQLKVAKKKGLNVVIHCREAHEDAMAIIKEILPSDYTIHLHCFTDTWEWAERWLKDFPNLFIGITNVVTFPSAECVHEVAKKIPLSRLLLETDAPYFIPRALPRTTKYSHPGMAIHVAAQIAALKDITLEEVLKATRKNTKRMYNI